MSEPTPQTTLISAISILEKNGALAVETGSQLRECVYQLHNEPARLRTKLDRIKGMAIQAGDYLASGDDIEVPDLLQKITEEAE